MGIINRIRNMGIFKQSPEKIEPTKIPTGLEVKGYSTELSAKKKEYLEEFQGWVGACVNAISDEVAAINLRLYKTAKDGSVEEVKEHEVLDLLYKVNAHTTKFDHFWITQSYLELVGECPWFLERTKNGIENIYFLRPDRITPLVGEDRLIKGYKYELSENRSDTVVLPLDSVIFLKYPDPAKPFRGIGTLQLAARTVDSDNYSEDWTLNFYKNSARPDSVLSVKLPNMDKEQLERLKESLKREYSGVKKAHKTMVLFGDMEWKSIGMSQKEMDFMEQKKFDRDKIMGIFRVPKAILAQTEGVNFASAKVAEHVFEKKTIKPKMEKLVQQMNEFLLPLFKGTEGMFLDFDNPVPEDEDAKYKRLGEVVNKVLTVNEVRAELGYPPLKGGDSIYMNVNQIPYISGDKENSTKSIVELKSDTKKKTLPPNYNERFHEMKARSKDYFKFKKGIDNLTQEVIKQIKKSLNEPDEVQESPDKKTDVRVISDDEKMLFWVKKNEITDEFIPKIREKTVEIYKRQRNKVLIKFDSLKGFKLDPNTIYRTVKLNERKEADEILKITFPVFEELFKDAGDEAYALLEMGEMDVKRDEIQKYLKSNILNFGTEFSKHTNEKIKKEIMDGVSNGESVDSIKGRVRKFFKDSEEYRADRIARSETVRYNTAASEQAYKDSGVVEAKQWFVNPGACQYCEPMNGVTIPLDEKFFEKGDTAKGDHGGRLDLDYSDTSHPPLHPNCRCEIIPIFK